MAVAIGVATVVAALASTAVSYMGAEQSAQATSNAEAYNAKVQQNNQIIANEAAGAALSQGAIAQQQKAYQEDLLIGQQKVGLAANGIDVGSGSAVDILGDTKAAGEFDQLTIANNTARTVQGFQNEGINYQNQATVDTQMSASTLAGGQLQGDAALFKGAGQVANSWYAYSNYGSGQTSNAVAAGFASSPQAGGIV